MKQYRVNLQLLVESDKDEAYIKLAASEIADQLMGWEHFDAKDDEKRTDATIALTHVTGVFEV